jgi:acyl transferase domain-containing protein
MPLSAAAIAKALHPLHDKQQTCLGKKGYSTRQSHRGVHHVAVAILAKPQDQHKEQSAIVVGSAINQDGRSSGLTAPNGPSQTSLIRDVISASHLAASSVTYVAVHGTGTPLGDPIEVSALGNAIAGARTAAIARPAAMGSVKACYGHTEGGAGITGDKAHLGHHLTRITG